VGPAENVRIFAELPVLVHSWLIKNNGSRSTSEANRCNCYTGPEEKTAYISLKSISLDIT